MCHSSFAIADNEDYVSVMFQLFFQVPTPGSPINNSCASFTTVDDRPIFVEDNEFFYVILNSTDNVNIIQEQSKAMSIIIDNDGRNTFPFFICILKHKLNK